jgi:uncharacterized protein
MICPVCKNDLIKKTYYQVPVMVCDQCDGIWFEEGTLTDYVQDMLIGRPDIPEQPLTLEKIPVIAEREIKDPIRLCPKCNKEMGHHNYCYDSNIILDKCDECNGIWMDIGKVEKIAQYHKVNPVVDAVGSVIAQQVVHHIQVDEIKDNLKEKEKK